MAVMNRSMFQRPMPVVRRMAGTPRTGEQNYEDQGYDAYEYRADKAMENTRVINLPDGNKRILSQTDIDMLTSMGLNINEVIAEAERTGRLPTMYEGDQPSFLSKIFDDITDFFKFGRSDPESRLIIAGEYFDPEDPSFKMFIENNYMSDGDTYIEAIEKFKAFAESQKRSEGSPMQGEIGASMYNELEGANDSPMIALKLAQKYGTPEEIAIMEKIFPITRKVGPSTLSKNESDFISQMIKKYSSKVGSDSLMQAMSSIDDDGKLTEDYMTDRVIERQQGSPMQGEQMNVENVGIMDGFSGDGSEAEAMAIVEEGERAKNEIDGTSTYDELMQSIRGDNLTEADRRQELASYVGEKDAEETPDSVLTLVQPVMQMLDEGTANTGIGQIEEGREMATIAPTQQDAEEMMAMNMPQQPVGVANGGYMSSFPNQNLNTESLSASDNIDDRIMQNLQFERMAPGMMGYANGGQVQHFASGDLAEIQNTYNERLPLYMDIINNPERSKGNTLMDISQSFLNYGMGADPREALSYFLDKTGKRVDQQAKTEQAIQMGALNAAIGKFDAKELATLKMLSEQSKKNKTMVVGLTKERDTMIAKLLGLYKEVPTYGYQDPDLAGDEFSAGQVKDGTTKIIDYEKLYELYPNGTELQFNNNFTEFLGKKGSGVRYEGVKKAEGGIVHRYQGTDSDGEIAEGIIEQEGVGTSTETDDINKLIARSNATLQELYRMKEILVNNPEIGGFPGMIFENLQGLFTVFDQIDNAYLGDKIFNKEGYLSTTFNKAEIQEIQNLKNSIARGIADLGSFKGSRQPTANQEKISLSEIDPTGWFGGDVAKQKVDAVADKVARLLKEYVKLVTVTDENTLDKEALAIKFTDIDNYVNSIKALSGNTDSSPASTEDVYTLDEIEEIYKLPNVKD